MPHPALNPLRSRSMRIGLAFTCGMLFLLSLTRYPGLVWDLVLARTGIRPEPTVEEQLRDCPALTFTLYRAYRLERDRSREIRVGLTLQDDSTPLPDPEVFSAAARARTAAEGFVLTDRLCEVSNWPGVRHVKIAAPGHEHRRNS